MERGFKSRCEEMARSLRATLGLKSIDPLGVDQLASYLDVTILSLYDIGLEDNHIRQLVEVDPDAWSAVTISAFGRDGILVNPIHRDGRYSSDVMHELSHLILDHEPSTMFFVGEGELALRRYNADSETEANWLAGALLMPRDALVYIHGRRLPQERVCNDYGVSKRMLNFRLNATGVSRQFRRRRN